MADSRIARDQRGGGTLAAPVKFIAQRPKLAASLIWWVFGLYALFFAAAPYTPSVEAEDKYHALMSQAHFSEEMRMSQNRLMRAQQALDQVQVFGWRWRSPYSSLVPPRQEEVEAARRDFVRVSAERDALISEAKSAVGIWSRYGVEEVRERFWGDYQWGKDLAKRMTFWDVIFGAGRGSRDEELLATAMRWIGQIIMNFTVGLVSALVAFGFSLVRTIWAYKTDLVSGFLFFFIAMSGASAMVALFVGGMTAVAVGGVYAVAQSGQARLGDNRRAHARVRHAGGHYGSRYDAPHYD